MKIQLNDLWDFKIPDDNWSVPISIDGITKLEALNFGNEIYRITLIISPNLDMNQILFDENDISKVCLMCEKSRSGSFLNIKGLSFEHSPPNLPKFFDENCCRLLYRETIKQNYGMNCTKCHSYNEYAQSNQTDGSFKCWSCRN